MPLLNKRLQQKKLTQMELTIQCASLVCMITTAYFYRSIWALLLGELLGNIIRLIWSHRINAECPNRFVLEREATREVVSFGKVDTAVHRDELPRHAGGQDAFGKTPHVGVVWRLQHRHQPGRSAQASRVPPERGRHFPADLGICPITLERSFERKSGCREGKSCLWSPVGLALFSCFGDIVIRILYDQRYDAAAWMLPILAIGMWPLVLVATVDGCLLSLGKPKYIAYGNFAKFLYMLVAIPLFFQALELQGRDRGGRSE